MAPAVNQIEIHPDFAQSETIARDAERGIVDQAWSPLGPGSALLQDPVIDGLARARTATRSSEALRRDT